MARGNAGLGRLAVPGFDYGSRYPKLLELADKFIRKITVNEWRMYWPYHLLDMGPVEICLFKLKRKLLGINDNVSYRLVSAEQFLESLREFMDELLSCGVDRSRFHTIVLNNAFEPFDPDRFTKYFHDARCIVVDRDPRDIFAVANQYSQGFNDQVELYRRIAGAFDVNVFINRIRVYRSHISRNDSLRVLRINYESLVQDYENTSSSIYSFLEINPSSHARKLSRFDPRKSQQNVGIWRCYHDQGAIRMIERALLG